jgi:hypothetical protein
MTSTAGQASQSQVTDRESPVSPAPTRDPGPGARDSTWLALAGIVVLGGISGLAYYLGFVRPYLLEQYYRAPLQDLARISGHTGRSANEWALTWIVLFACYFLAFRLCPSGASSAVVSGQWPVVSRGQRTGHWPLTTDHYVGLFLICGFAAFFAINLIFMYPVGAADLFDQIFRARLTAHYNLNPFTTVPNSIVNDPLKAYVAWTGDPSPYGPMWELPAAGVSLLAGDSLWKNLVLFKLLVTVAYGISVALTYGILRRVRPDWALRGTLFFAWNPLVLFEVPGNGHNDALVVAFMLAGVYFFTLPRRVAVLPAIMAGALTKFVPALLLPAAAAAIWRDRVSGEEGRRQEAEGRGPLSAFCRFLGFAQFRPPAFATLAVGTVIAIGLGLVVYARFWTGTGSIGALGRQTLFTASLPKVVLDVLTYDLGMNTDDKIKTAQSLVRDVALALTAAVSLGWGLRILLRRNAHTGEERQALVDTTLVAFYEVIFFYLAFASLWFQPWYLMWLVALTAPVARFANANRTILFCIGGVANYFVWDFIWLWNRDDIRDNQISSALAIYTLPLLYTFYVLMKPKGEGLGVRG